MASIDSLKASNGSGSASVATIQNVRSAGATTLIVDTVQNINDNFYGTMGTPHTFVDPVTGEEITVISEATAVDFKGHVDGTNLEIDTIAPGFVDGGSSVNDIVIIKPTTQWADEVAEVLEVVHEDDGTLKDDTVGTDQILDSNVTTAKIVDEAITAAKTDFGGNYSTSEVNTGFKWVDDKAIYKKTINFGALPNNTSKAVAHGLTGVDRIFRVDGVAYDSNSALPLPYFSATAASGILLAADSTNVNIQTGSNRSTYTAYVTLWYTKT